MELTHLRLYTRRSDVGACGALKVKTSFFKREVTCEACKKTEFWKIPEVYQRRDGRG